MLYQNFGVVYDAPDSGCKYFIFLVSTNGCYERIEMHVYFLFCPLFFGYHFSMSKMMFGVDEVSIVRGEALY